MPEVRQADFMRGVRGETINPDQTPQIEPIVKGLSSISRAAIRRVHNESPDEARAYFAQATAKFRLRGGRAAATVDSYRSSLEQYIEWDGVGQDADLDIKGTVTFSPDDRVRALAHVVFGSDDGARRARVLLWDSVTLGQRAAEMIALPIVECVNAEYGADKTSEVEVWQLALGQRYSVAPEDAEGRRGEVESFFADL